jgi:hypothetical protein
MQKEQSNRVGQSHTLANLNKMEVLNTSNVTLSNRMTPYLRDAKFVSNGSNPGHLIEQEEMPSRTALNITVPLHK